MFDYKKFENDVVQQMTVVFNKWICENNDLYIFSLDCTREMGSIGVIANTKHYLDEQAESNSEDYWYYKYCEEEWDLFDIFEVISGDMRKYMDETSDIFTNHATDEYSEAFDEHCGKIIECCQNALIRFRQFINQNYQSILLTFNIREYLGEEEKIKIFKKVNSENTLQEYIKYIDEFA